MNKKYILTEEKIEYHDITLYRIKAIKKFSNVREGELGGWVEKEDNLSQRGNCWIYDNAKVYDKARVYGNARVNKNAKVCGNARVHDKSIISDEAVVKGNANIYEKALVINNAIVRDNAKVCGNAMIQDKSQIYDDATVRGESFVLGNARVYGNTEVTSGEIIGRVQIPYKQIEFYKRQDTRLLTAILTLNDEWKFNLGCQELLSKEQLLDRINEHDGGLDKNSHRQFYLRILKLF